MESITGNPGITRQIILQDHTVLACPYCWDRTDIWNEYPELSKYPISNTMCERHFRIVLTGAIERLGWVKP